MGSLDAMGKKTSSDVVSTYNNAESPEPGIYFAIVSAVKYIQKDEYEIVELDILGGVTPGQAGKQLALFMKRKDNDDYGDVHHRFALATGLLKPGTKTGEIDFSFFKKAEGRYIVVAAELSDDDKVFVGNYGLDIWGPHESDIPAKLTDMDGDVAAIFAQAGSGTPVASTAPAAQSPDSQIASGGNGESQSEFDKEFNF